MADGRSAGYPDAVYDNQIADITNFENLFGPSYVTYTQGSIPHTTYTYGLYRDETDVLRNMGTLLVHINQFSYIYGLDNTPDWEGYQSVTFGTYLVRETVVPIPSTDDDGGGCFIATAAYGSHMAEEVVALRKFRDSVLLNSAVGKGFVKLYYKISPPLATYLNDHEISRKLTKLSLTPIVYAVNCPKTSILILLSTIIAMTLIVRRSHRF